MSSAPGVRARPPKAEALTVAMALAPGVYARNRMFEFFKRDGVQRAKSRASTLLGIVRQLDQARAVSVSTDDVGGRGAGEPRFVLRYVIPDMRLSRVAELSRLELATLRVLAQRAGATCLPVDPSDRVLVDAALAQLLAGDETGAIARAAQGASAAPASLEGGADPQPRPSEGSRASIPEPTGLPLVRD